MTTNDTREAIHREIEQLAFAMLDAAPALAHSMLGTLAAKLVNLNESRTAPLLLEVGCKLAERGDSPRVQLLHHGPHLALMDAALAHVLFGRSREPLRYCPHLSPEAFVTAHEPFFVIVAEREVLCTTCWVACGDDAERKQRLARDDSCDVCGVAVPLLTARLIPMGSALVWVYTCHACDGLLSQDNAPNTKVGRNQPCPCGSGRKTKHCHGRNS
jgi:hypothetical protein